jgi:hypothetical protein
MNSNRPSRRLTIIPKPGPKDERLDDYLRSAAPRAAKPIPRASLAAIAFGFVIIIAGQSPIVDAVIGGILVAAGVADILTKN